MSKVDLFDKDDRAGRIQERLAAFDAEAAAAEDKPEVKQELRRFLAEELQGAASLVEKREPGKTDYQRLRSAYELRLIEAETATGFNYPRSRMRPPNW